MEKEKNCSVVGDERRSMHKEDEEKSKVVNNFESDIDKRKESETSQTSNSGDDSPLEGSSVINTKLPPGKVIINKINGFLTCFVIVYSCRL